MLSRILTYLAAVLACAGLTLGTVLGVVRGTILAVGIRSVPLRGLAVAADLLCGTVLLLGCIYLSTRLVVSILGVGSGHFSVPRVDAVDSEE